MAGDTTKESRNMKRIATVLPLALILCSCASSKKMHIGTWEATGITEDGYVLKLARNNKAQVTTPEGVYQGEYAIDYAKTPTRLDVTWDGRTTKCILEFLDKERFKIIGVSSSGKLRPLTFEPAEDIVIFKKVKKSK